LHRVLADLDPDNEFLILGNSSRLTIREKATRPSARSATSSGAGKQAPPRRDSCHAAVDVSDLQQRRRGDRLVAAFAAWRTRPRKAGQLRAAEAKTRLPTSPPVDLSD
jgi:hypothetical protein